MIEPFSRMDVVEMLLPLGIQPAAFWGAQGAKPNCMFFPTPAEYPLNRLTWRAILVNACEKVQATYDVVIGERLARVDPKEVRTYSWTGTYRFPRPLHSLFQRVTEVKIGEISPESLEFIDGDGDGTPEYVVVDLSIVDDWYAGDTEFGRWPDRVMLSIKPSGVPDYDIFPLVHRVRYAPGLKVVMPAAVVIDPGATIGQRGPLSPMEYAGTLIVHVYYFYPSCSTIISRDGLVRLYPCESSLYAHYGLRFTEIAKIVFAEYPSEACSACLSGILEELRQDYLLTRYMYRPFGFPTIGTKRGHLEAAIAMEQYLRSL